MTSGTKSEHTETRHTTVGTRDGGTITKTHKKHVEVDEAGTKTSLSQDHQSGEGEHDQPAEVDASMPPGGTYG